MAIKFSLLDNPIAKQSDALRAQVKSLEVLDTSNVIDKIVARNSGLSSATVQACVQLFYEEVANSVADGFSVNTPLANFRPSIRGVFNSHLDGFDSARHQLGASISAGVLLNEKIQQASVEKLTLADNQPLVKAYMDGTTKGVNASITLGGIADLMGKELNFDFNNPEEGVFFVDEQNVATRVSYIHSQSSQKLVFVNPTTLLSGWYSLEVRKAYTNSKQIRKGLLKQKLQVL